MQLKQSRMRPSTWVTIKGPKPKNLDAHEQPVPPDKFATTHILIKGSIKGRIALFFDDLFQAGHKTSNI
eukprot:2554346-Prorocentrum_lima.AAC.1